MGFWHTLCKVHIFHLSLLEFLHIHPSKPLRPVGEQSFHWGGGGGGGGGREGGGANCLCSFSSGGGGGGGWANCLCSFSSVLYLSFLFKTSRLTAQTLSTGTSSDLSIGINSDRMMSDLKLPLFPLSQLYQFLNLV